MPCSKPPISNGLCRPDDGIQPNQGCISSMIWLHTLAGKMHKDLLNVHFPLKSIHDVEYVCI